MKNILRNYLKKFNKNYQADFLLKNEFKYFKNSKKILDLGCGKGDFLKIAPHRIIGIDTNKRSILSCRKQKLSAFFGNVTKLHFKANSFDGVHASHIIEHLYPADAYKMLNEVGRVLKKGGIFVLSTPLLWKGFYDDFTHIKPYNPESIIRYLVNDGSQKTLPDIAPRFKKIHLSFRFRPLPLPGKIGHIVSSYLYRYGMHSCIRDAYTLVLKKI